MATWKKTYLQVFFDVLSGRRGSQLVVLYNCLNVVYKIAFVELLVMYHKLIFETYNFEGLELKFHNKKMAYNYGDTPAFITPLQALPTPAAQCIFVRKPKNYYISATVSKISYFFPSLLQSSW